jgi:hypothetical protein
MSNRIIENMADASVIADLEYFYALGVFERVDAASGDVDRMEATSTTASELVVDRLKTAKLAAEKLTVTNLSTETMTTGTLSTQSLSTDNLVTNLFTAINLTTPALGATSVVTNTMVIGGGSRVVRVDYGREKIPSYSGDGCLQHKMPGLTIVEGATGHFDATIINTKSDFNPESMFCSVIHDPGETSWEVNVLEVNGDRKYPLPGGWAADSFIVDWIFTQLK